MHYDEVSDSSDEDEQHDDSAQRPRPVSAEKQLRRTILSDYVTAQAQKLTNEALRKASRSPDEERLSIRNLLANEEGRKITTSREYQIELCERAKLGNIIAVLDTGSGKTHIAVLLMQHVLEQEVEGRAAGKLPRVAFFLANSVALVMQQHSVLSENLPHAVEALCGAMNVDLWTQSVWTKHCEQNMAFVCTAEVLYQCLWHGFLTIDQINLLVFDEAHHAKKGHPYAKIIRDFYLSQEDPARRPKIFGMTASPVDVKIGEVYDAAMDLERMLQAQIVTTSNLELLQTFVSRPQESVARYFLHPATFATPLCQQMKARYGDVEAFQKLFEAVEEAARELGPWCADLYWESALSEAEAKKKETRTEKAFRKKGDHESVLAKQDEQIAKLREAAEFIQSFEFGKPSLNATSLSNKVSILHDFLHQYFSRPSDARCIVFVTRRVTARILTEVFVRHEERPAHLRPGLLVGNARSDDVSITFRQQFLDLQKFRRGDINCLFATSIAEEGLDIPACNVVVRFDPCTSMIQYVQSRGRARHHNSKFLHMIESGNAEHDWLLQNVRTSEVSTDRAYNDSQLIVTGGYADLL